eukprot:9488087-Pyramimonas_sp.AAC.1
MLPALKATCHPPVRRPYPYKSVFSSSSRSCGPTRQLPLIAAVLSSRVPLVATSDPTTEGA